MTIDRPTGLSAGFHARLRQAGVPGLVDAGDQHAPTSWIVPTHTHDVWELYLQLAGPPTRWTAAERTWHVPSRGLLVVPPGVPHAMAASSTAPYHFYYVALAPAAFMRPDDLHPVWRQRHPFVITDAGSMITPFELFLREVTTHQPLRTAGLACTAALLVIESSRLADNRRPGPHLAMHPAIATAKRLIENHLADGHTVDDLAAATHLSPAYLAELFRNEIGETPGRYRTRLRIERARLLLSQTDLPITMIATDLGYSSSQHFATAFRRETETTPSRYRRTAADRTPPRPQIPEPAFLPPVSTSLCTQTGIPKPNPLRPRENLLCRRRIARRAAAPDRPAVGPVALPGAWTR